jgi:hypothetical protein
MGYSQHVQTLNEGVIQQKHNSGQVPRCLGIPKQHLANITNIPGFWVSQAELPLMRVSGGLTTGKLGGGFLFLPDYQRRVEHKCCLHGGQDEAGYQAEDRIGIRKRHDGQADVLGKEESGRLQESH